MTGEALSGTLPTASNEIGNGKARALRDRYRTSEKPSSQLDNRWALAASMAGAGGMVSYIAVAAMEVASPLAATLAFAFAFGITVFSIGLYRVLAGPGGSALGLIAAVANIVAAAQLLAMLLVQMAVGAAVPDPGPALTAIWLGLDVAWDLYVGTGTVLFAACMVRRRGFGAWLGVPGLTVGALLLVLNIATFPTPPVNAGFFDPGPIVGLWYLAVSARLGWLWFRREVTARKGEGVD